jgi:hypothetical protein
MADAVTTDVLFSGTRKHVVHLTNVSDGTGEAAVAKVDISTLALHNGDAPTKAKIYSIEWDVEGMSVALLADHTSDVTMLTMVGRGSYDGGVKGAITGEGAGGTGDILLTTAGATAGDSYDLTLTLVLS